MANILAKEFDSLEVQAMEAWLSDRMGATKPTRSPVAAKDRQESEQERQRTERRREDGGQAEKQRKRERKGSRTNQLLVADRARQVIRRRLRRNAVRRVAQGAVRPFRAIPGVGAVARGIGALSVGIGGAAGLGVAALAAVPIAAGVAVAGRQIEQVEQATRALISARGPLAVNKSPYSTHGLFGSLFMGAGAPGWGVGFSNMTINAAMAKNEIGAIASRIKAWTDAITQLEDTETASSRGVQAHWKHKFVKPAFYQKKLKNEQVRFDRQLATGGNVFGMAKEPEPVGT